MEHSAQKSINGRTYRCALGLNGSLGVDPDKCGHMNARGVGLPRVKTNLTSKLDVNGGMRPDIYL